MISAQALAPEGRLVKCSKCSETWRQAPDPDELIDNLEQSIEDIPEAVKPIPEGSSVPAVREEDEVTTDTKQATTGKTKAVSLTAAAFIFILIYALLMLVKTPMTQSWPGSIALYNALGMSVQSPGHGVEFDRIYAEIGKDGHIKVEGFVLNLTSDKQTIPNINATIKDSHGEDLATWQIPAPQKSLEAEGSVEFKAEYSEKVKAAESLQLNFTLGKVTAEAPIEHVDEHHAGDHADPHHPPAHDDTHH
jgi:hypothetical protein